MHIVCKAVRDSRWQQQQQQRQQFPSLNELSSPETFFLCCALACYALEGKKRSPLENFSLRGPNERARSLALSLANLPCHAFYSRPSPQTFCPHNSSSSVRNQRVQAGGRAFCVPFCFGFIFLLLFTVFVFDSSPLFLQLPPFIITLHHHHHHYNGHRNVAHLQQWRQ